MSPWAEVIRAALGVKALAWHSVTVPNILPKPHQTELSGNYARTPVLQIGADIFCDTTAIIAALEPFGPSLLGPGQSDLAATAQGPTFFAAVGAAMGNGGRTDNMDAFWEDRKARFGMDPTGFMAMVPALIAAFHSHLDSLETRLSDARPFLLGDTVGHADLAHYSLVWFQQFAGNQAELLIPRPHLAAWTARVAAFGHGTPTPLSGEAAIAIAAESTPFAGGPIDPASGFTANQPVAISQPGCADPATIGPLLALNDTGIVIARHSDQAGPLALHFPRLGQAIAAA
ncbi:glutathione S-transferase family protein [Sandaracinobacteroides saxicola]|uniref:Glutathione S-transferase family protein n=1 Tax=Sandaracinobacteroides saxicola TaxID=2759707 RepID=A0A7G5IIG9_9SPHN|nr:glutathione S-transferase family protein [Sandaracinobacteroides saxicola]QMW23161.1 glutathione S-transferase family protein [Sandaracinobacteroides saxicola]